MLKPLSQFVHGVRSVIFPDICICCGIEGTAEGRHICSFCLQERFEKANPRYESSSSGVILPDGVPFQHALWQFDQGGALQDLLHHLKYEHLTTVGIDIGERLGEDLRAHPFLNKQQDRILVPVPLHYLKFRKRGFNQAFFIARGIQQRFKMPICDIRTVTRVRNTRTQTGFSLKKRMSNVRNAFLVRDPKKIEGRQVLVVDDVFTTGATSFELAATLLEAGASSVPVVTVAQA